MFAYDANGNLAKDSDRNIVAIRYNILNLPEVIQFRNGNQIKNTYDAGGRKLGTEYFTQLTYITPLDDGQIISQSYNPGTVNQTGNVYIENFEYATTNGNASLMTLSRIYNAEGYVENTASPMYYYYRRDHLGNNREVWCANTKQTVQRTQYYPSGLPWASNTGDNPGLQNKKYNGKEFIEMHSYDTYDYGARGYYPAMGRFMSVDPLAEKYYSISPYAYCAGNPVNRIDPDGMDWEITISKDKNGNLIYNFTVNAVLYNNSSSTVNMDKLAQGITAQVMKAFNFSGDGFKVSMDFNMRAVNSIDEISETDHVFQVVDQNTLPADNDSKVLANGETNGLNIRIGSDLANDIVSGKNQRSAAHELGHTGSLSDVNKNPKGVGLGSLDNLMMQSEFIMKKGANVNPNKSTNLTYYQINQIYDNRKALNQNSPIAPLNGYNLKLGIIFTPVKYKILRR